MVAYILSFVNGFTIDLTIVKPKYSYKIRIF